MNKKLLNVVFLAKPQILCPLIFLRALTSAKNLRETLIYNQAQSDLKLSLLINNQYELSRLPRGYRIPSELLRSFKRMIMSVRISLRKSAIRLHFLVSVVVLR